MHTVGPGIWW